jgi:hypothetical protein
MSFEFARRGMQGIQANGNLPVVFRANHGPATAVAPETFEYCDRWKQQNQQGKSDEE